MELEILDFSLCFADETMIFSLLQKLLEKRFVGKKYMVFFLISIFVIALILNSISTEFLAFKNIIMFIINLCMASLLYVDKWHVKLTIIILAFYIFLITDIIFGNLVSLIADEHFVELFYEHFEQRLIICYIIKFINAFVFIWIYQMLRKISLVIRTKGWTMFGLVAILFWLISITFMSIYPSEDVPSYITLIFFVISIGFFIMSMIVVWFFSELCCYYQSEKNIYLNESKQAAIEKQMALQNQVNERISKMQHDMKKHIKNASILFQNRDFVMADSLLQELGNDLNNINIGITQTSGNSMIDAVVTYGVSLCESKNIKFKYKLERVGATHIKSAELSSVLSNLLDNAIEAAEKAVNPGIELKIFRYKEYLTIIVKNTYQISPIVKGNKLITTKSSKLFHGMGTEIIKEIVEKNRGNFRYAYDGEYFTITALLMMQ